jgi:hypothetical protein
VLRFSTLRIVDLITYTFAPHPQPLSQREKGAGEFPFSLWEKGLGDEGSAKRIAFKFVGVI